MIPVHLAQGDIRLARGNGRARSFDRTLEKSAGGAEGSRGRGEGMQGDGEKFTSEYAIDVQTKRRFSALAIAPLVIGAYIYDILSLPATTT
ncbi:hypothetical protein HZH66_003347 [Vespula vulgaris]|uniref:Uncharacterized protein n=1 Tax=Vespula vulgaris TaxID=7454 RepID=A0A834NG31_VESVU|nr:hypothetical protein HZH66_003347 [Vespula vulgaris]